MAVCVAVVNRSNAPKYIACVNPDMELEFHYKVHTSLDVIEERLTSTGKSNTESREFYLGILYSTEEHTIYGYVTNTRTKFMIITETSNKLLRDNEVRAMFRKLHSAYTHIVCNPFYVPGDDIKSKYFEQVAKSVMVGG
uniref:Trafficking protein particle complex subunit 2-like protein n=1 Tax=Cacopsylla melanoneura TaxID=428564 RepID=A0A8D8RVH5_9HEMI